MLENSSLKELKKGKNLLAFSGGGDSTALFFSLIEYNINFDIAIVNYNTREQSLDELEYAKEISYKNNITCHILNAEKIDKNFEAKAREIRYDFFHTLITKYNYNNLLTAHHLGDRFEWMLMQFCKGSGCLELAGMQEIEKRDNYTLIRPLLHLDKSQLLSYLNINKLKYFEDETNLDESIKRNSFRHKYTKPLLEKYLNGIKKSFEYIDCDRDEILNDVKIEVLKRFAYFKSSDSKRVDIYNIDQYLKKNHHLMSAEEKKLLKNTKTVIIGRKFVINQNGNYIFIAPYIKNSKMDKKFKNECRVLKIEPKLRGYLNENRDIFLKIKTIFS
jgi:tRNA(Ile)-lysidine synthase